MTYTEVLHKSISIIQMDAPLDAKMTAICDLLNNSFDKYDWTGFYIADKVKKVLHLGPYVGEKTEHTEIPFGNGICGQAAVAEKTFLIDDVSAESNYISCNIHVKSEIVVPIIYKGQILGQIDVDSNTLGAFNKDDQDLLEQICQQLGPHFDE